MELIEQLAEAALQRDSLRLRSLVQDIARANINWSMISRPVSNDLRLLALSVFYKLKSAQFTIEKVPTLKKERLKLLFKKGPLYY